MRKIICDICKKELPSNSPYIIRVTVEVNTPHKKVTPMVADICISCIQSRKWTSLFNLEEYMKSSPKNTTTEVLEVLDTLAKTKGDK